VGFVGLCLLVGAADGSVIADWSRAWYLSMRPPPMTVPDWLFTPLWTVLSVAMGVAGWLVWRRTVSPRPLRLWGWQLAATASWTPAFFVLHSPLLALAVGLVLGLLIVLTMQAFRRLQPLAAWLMAPCLGWAAYMSYLAAGFWWLNPG